MEVEYKIRDTLERVSKKFRRVLQVGGRLCLNGACLGWGFFFFLPLNVYTSLGSEAFQADPFSHGAMS